MSDESNVLIVSHADRGGRIRIIPAHAARLITELNTIPRDRLAQRTQEFLEAPLQLAIGCETNTHGYLRFSGD